MGERYQIDDFPGSGHEAMFVQGALFKDVRWIWVKRREFRPLVVSIKRCRDGVCNL